MKKLKAQQQGIKNLAPTSQQAVDSLRGKHSKVSKKLADSDASSSSNSESSIQARSPSSSSSSDSRKRSDAPVLVKIRRDSDPRDLFLMMTYLMKSLI
jgi:hypothetical protein